jgi:hypothetical protein
MRQHFRTGRLLNTAACGRGGAYPVSTADTNLVTCQRCQRTWAYRAAHRRQEVTNLTVVHSPEAVEALTSGLTPEQIAVKTALDAFIKSAHDEAVEQGVCSTYDEIMESIEGSLPRWYTMPQVPQKWTLSAANRYVDERMTEDEAYKHIAENIKDFISLESY